MPTIVCGINIVTAKMVTSPADIEKLTEIFNAAYQQQLDDEELEDEDTPQVSGTQCTSNKSRGAGKAKKTSPYDKVEDKAKKQILNPDLDDLEKLYFDDDNQVQSSWKNTPVWDISYRQSVSASDVFLGMGFKNSSTSSCENMIVTIALPGEKYQNMDLKIEKTNLILNSSKFFLDLKLPQPVDPKRGNAQYDKECEKLIVTLIMERELDELNF